VRLDDDVEPGPSRALESGAQALSSPWEEPEDWDPRKFVGKPKGAGLSKIISDKQAKQLIYKNEMAPFGLSPMAAAHVLDNMIDVNVDQVIGPNVRENILKSLNTKVMAQTAMGPLPQVKDEKSRLSKQKHQITHLAGIAVAREEQLQEQWAESRAKKKQSAKKYGF